jgi:acyl-CoA thioester hydrolase
MIPPPRREDFRYFCRLDTRWGDVDSMGHINNAKYITYDEQARTDYIHQRQADAGLTGPNFILARICCDFLQQLHHPSQIDYGMRITRIGRSSMETQGAIFVGDRCYSRTQGVVVWFDYTAQKTQPIPDSIRRSVIEFEIVKPAE